MLEAETPTDCGPSFFGPEHHHFSKSFQIRLGIDESCVDATMAKDVDDSAFAKFTRDLQVRRVTRLEMLIQDQSLFLCRKSASAYAGAG
jgi:hypothetical protein